MKIDFELVRYRGSRALPDPVYETHKKYRLLA
jgi:hypothetical protein